MQADGVGMSEVAILCPQADDSVVCVGGCPDIRAIKGQPIRRAADAKGALNFAVARAYRGDRVFARGSYPYFLAIENERHKVAWHAHLPKQSTIARAQLPHDGIPACDPDVRPVEEHSLRSFADAKRA